MKLLGQSVILDAVFQLLESKMEKGQLINSSEFRKFMFEVIAWRESNLKRRKIVVSAIVIKRA